MRLPADRVSKVLTPAVVATCLAVTYWRLYVGFDFTDDAYYVAVPYHLIRGANVFVDDTAVAQGFVALLVYPFLRAYYAVAGLDGIILFARHLQFAISIGAAAATAVALRAVMPLARGLLAALLLVVFVPFNLHAVSYNTLGTELFTVGLALGFRSLRRPEERSTQIA